MLGYPAAPWQYTQQPPKFGGAPLAVRILMFVGGGFGLLLGGLFGILAAMVSGGGRNSEDVLAGMRDSGLPLSAGEAVLGLAVVGAIPFVYGVVSIVLASLMGRRSPVILWSVVAFQGLAAASLFLNVLTGTVGSVVPLAFAVLMIVLMLLEGTRAYYTRPAPSY